MSKPSFVIILVEDEHHEMLIRRYLKSCGLETHQMTFKRSPAGSGSAENWVRKNFAKEVSAYRNRQTRARTALIVAIDADTYSLPDRLQQLDQALIENGKPRLDSDREQIARLIPKRNVETWILCLNGEAVNEQNDYRNTRRYWSDLIHRAGKTLNGWCKSDGNPPWHCVDSLRFGVRELVRLRI